MGKNRGMAIALVIVAAIAVVAAGVAFATYSAALSIQGTGTVKSANWEVRFENLSSATLTGNAREVTHPTINTNDTHISTYDVNFVDPGDSISYTFDVANNGSLDAKISSFQISTPTCTGSGTNADVDAQNVCNNLSYTLTYEDGTAISAGNVLTAGDKKTMKLTLTYNSNVPTEQLPTNDVAISGLNVSVMYALN